jgi:hypothetical protein
MPGTWATSRFHCLKELGTAALLPTGVLQATIRTPLYFDFKNSIYGLIAAM